MEVFIHAANATFLVSFLVRDILKLRVLSVIGGGFLLAFFFLSNPVVWSGIGWNVVFSLINGVQITRLIMERRPVRLSPEEHKLHQLAFRALSPREMVRVLGVIDWLDPKDGDRLVETGRDPERLLVVVDGALDVVVGADHVARLGPGQFAGEMTFLTGNPPRADVVAVETSRIAALDGARLKKLLATDAELRGRPNRSWVPISFTPKSRCSPAVLRSDRWHIACDGRLR
ncbi:MAG: cyclic nucleotide-binding domain-containing protein [Polyangiaceae bacterium]|nr:cyclic nucleotide-binding domain-containing protein [Polyangiaceae bacterium]